VVGPAAPPCAGLRDIAVAPLTFTKSEVEQRLHLLSPIPGLRLVRRLSFRRPRIAGFEGYLNAHKSKPFAVINPGARLSERRAPLEAFIVATREVQRLDVQPVVTWGPGEREIAEELVRSVAGSELAPPTNLDEMAALMESARMTICNNTGPMHLSVAVGCPTLAFFFGIDVERWGYSQAPHRVLDLTNLQGQETEAIVVRQLRAYADSLYPTARA
jgi:ADP-heptose:LPS heptosyltransferase